MPRRPHPPSSAALARAVSLVLTTTLAAGLGSSGTAAQTAPPPSLEAQVAAQPYRIGDRAGFKPLYVTDLDILVLGDDPDALGEDLEVWGPYLSMVVSASPSPATAGREAFARRALEFIVFASDIEVEGTATVRQGLNLWHETVGRGLSVSGAELLVYQAILYGAPGRPYLRVVGLAPAEMREAVLPRFRQVSRSITLKSTPGGAGT
ncbi:hypothetical protein F8S09_01330 [Deinococcus sp. SDU3-2]|uniref:Uncharacterized protein n=1 Tax=Deinococcus terrestris TaxID=2651870 RepID=A0A7X1TQK8_9DEIO|nr:hypothetical protein [Deinococcus terrestris]MPY65337.1 hypothetical protein [Deinococcus terrestris]